MIVKPMPGSDLGMYEPAEEPEKKPNGGGFKSQAQADKGTYRYVIATKLNNLSQRNGIRKAKEKIQADLKKEFQAALNLPATKSLGTYTHDPSKCHVLNPETTNPNASDEEYEQMHREIKEEKQKQQGQKKKATKSGCCGSSSCQGCPSSAERVLGGDEVRYFVYTVSLNTDLILILSLYLSNNYLLSDT